MKEKIDVFDYAPEILKAMKTGILLTTKADDKVNTMTIGWGVLGIEWSTPIFTAFVRESRFTRSCLDKNPEFTVNVPLGDYNKKDVDGSFPMCNQDYHIAYYGEIVSAYIIKPE